MRKYAFRLGIVVIFFLVSLGVGVLTTQEARRIPFSPDQIASATGLHDITWSPDGKFLAYVSARGGNSQVWVISSSGRSPKRITSSPLTKRDPRWSPDGKWIAYVAEEQDGAGDIYISSPDGETFVRLTESFDDESDPRWSPDGTKLAFNTEKFRGSHLEVIDIHTHAVQRLTDTAAFNPQWSPDGNWIAFVSDPLLPQDDRRDNEDLFIVPASGGNARLLTPRTPRFREFAPSWAPDSRRLVFTSDATGNHNLYTIDIQTGQTRPLTSGNVEDLFPKWSPDGNTIAFVRNENFLFHMWTIPPTGGRAVRLSERDGTDGGFEREDSSPHGSFQWSPDGKRIAYTHSDPGRTPDLWIMNADGTRPVQITNSMPVELRASRFVWPDLFSYRSFDGLEISALIYKPRGPKPGSNYPTLLMFRDTLDGQNAVTWNPFVQFFVSRGYLVFAPNIRGSSGRGKEYRQMIFRHGGDHDVRDAFVGLDRLSSEGLVDSERIGVFGAGTGGFLTTAALVKDEARFRAAVCLYGIMDATTASSYPGMFSWSRYMIGESPMSNPLPYYERSLVNFVDKLRTPIIFLYAGDNRMAKFQQLEQFAVQAEVKGKWYDYRVFENEPPGWHRWRSNSLRMALEAMDALFEKYLLGKDREIRLSRRQ